MATPANSHKITIDPVCKMNVDPGKAALMSNYKGKDYYFCAGACRESFDKNPQKHLESKPAKRKGLWGRYLERLNKVTCGRTPPGCH